MKGSFAAWAEVETPKTMIDTTPKIIVYLFFIFNASSLSPKCEHNPFFLYGLPNSQLDL